MLEALIVTLREGIEAALVVGIIVAFLRREGRQGLLGAVWSGLGAAVLASVAGALVLYRVAVDEEVLEGILYLTSALVVGTLVVWMWRHARSVAGELRGSLARILDRRRTWTVVGGIFLFTFLMVFREGIETVFFLSALSLSTSGLMAATGTVIGVSAAVTFGVLFVRGSLRIDLGRFFTVTSIALLIFVVQLLVNGYHELAEAGWMPASEASMGIVGPLVRNEFFFVAAVVFLPLLLILVPSRPQRAAVPPAATGAEGRLQRAAALRQRRVRTLAGTLGLTILIVLSYGFVRAQPLEELSASTPLTVGPGGDVRLPVASLADGKLHRFSVDLDGHHVRFIALRLDTGKVVTAFDACEICGARGYIQDGAAIACLHCRSVIYPPSIGRSGGCNPIPLPSRRQGSEVTIAGSDLASGAAIFDATAPHPHHG